MKTAISLMALFFLVCCHSSRERKNGRLIHSDYTNDDYLIDVRLPPGFDPGKAYHLLYFADGTIGLGDYILGKDSSWMAEQPPDCIFITIGHMGDWEEKRRRDFIPSDAGGHRDENFGRADLFYAFLKNELVPRINREFPKIKSSSFTGHSFSGLFSLYAALKNEQLFDRYFAISPSVWANERELITIEEKFFSSGKDLTADIQIYAGGLEIFNRVLSSTKSLVDNLQDRHYKNLVIDLDVVPNANHFSVRKPAIDRILQFYR